MAVECGAAAARRSKAEALRRNGSSTTSESKQRERERGYRLLDKLNKPEMLILNHLYKQIERYQPKAVKDQKSQNAYGTQTLISLCRDCGLVALCQEE